MPSLSPTLFPWRNQDGCGFAHTAAVVDNCVVFYYSHSSNNRLIWIHIFSVYIGISLDYLLKGNFC